jgi:hypothetical protein
MTRAFARADRPGGTLFNVVTIAREYGSGGAELGRLVAVTLGWELLDRQLVDRVARIAGLEAETAASLDEHAHSWWQRALAGMSYAAPFPTPDGSGEFDEDSMRAVTMGLIRGAADSGGCVIVGRGAQFFLQERKEVFNVLAYAPIEERVRRLRARHPDCTDVYALIKQVDGQRASYIREYYGRDWLDKTLYELCINTALGFEVAAELITTAIGAAKK